ncbi:TMEM175 family protein [Halomarina salina]|uniref:TMEM175 family protein n=1 Tax=Halomarina salina TaxID=1872699 RepID=A0ABD5RNQ6_9EURY|nr:TMEM175 family protein [Halomarina salina]
MATDDYRPDTRRLAALSDGVFAIAITILVLSIDLPSGSDAGPVTVEMVAREWRDAVSYVLSFLVVGNFWTEHRHVFDHATHHTRDVEWLNILFLMAIAFLPFPTSLLGDYGGLVPVVFYAAVMTTTGLLLYALWWVVARNEAFFEEELAPERVRYDRLRFLLYPSVFGVSIPVALFVSLDLVYVCWGSLFVLTPLLQRRLLADGGETLPGGR